MTRTLTLSEKQFMNANGDVGNNDVGFQVAIQTLTQLSQKIVEQKFYEISISDFMNIDVGSGAWAEEYVEAREYYVGGGFEEGDIDDHVGSGKLSEVDAAVDTIAIPNRFWGKKVSWRKPQLEQAARNMIPWDQPSAKLRSLKKNWDLGVQELAFLGHSTISRITGLLNNREVNNNTSILPVPISSMSQAQMNNFVKLVLNAYFVNSNSTQMPNRFVIPTSDYLGLGQPFPGSVAQITMLEYLLNMFKRQSRNEDFDIIPLKYAEKEFQLKRGNNVLGRYTLYYSTPKNIETPTLRIPIDFQFITGRLSDDNLTVPTTAFGQYSGVKMSRPREMLYLDVLPA
jgi:hypothetical protein